MNDLSTRTDNQFLTRLFGQHFLEELFGGLMEMIVLEVCSVFTEKRKTTTITQVYSRQV